MQIVLACFLAVASATYGYLGSKYTSGYWNNNWSQGRRMSRSVANNDETGEISHQVDTDTAELYYSRYGTKQHNGRWNNNWSQGRRWARSAEKSDISHSDIDAAEQFLGNFNGRWIVISDNGVPLYW